VIKGISEKVETFSRACQCSLLFLPASRRMCVRSSNDAEILSDQFVWTEPVFFHVLFAVSVMPGKVPAAYHAAVVATYAAANKVGSVTTIGAAGTPRESLLLNRFRGSPALGMRTYNAARGGESRSSKGNIDSIASLTHLGEFVYVPAQ
jgi:hypothetical protein